MLVLGPTQPTMQWVLMALLGVKPFQLEVDHSLSSSVEVKTGALSDVPLHLHDVLLNSRRALHFQSLPYS
jgi:hypothetical protein